MHEHVKGLYSVSINWQLMGWCVCACIVANPCEADSVLLFCKTNTYDTYLLVIIMMNQTLHTYARFCLPHSFDTHHTHTHTPLWALCVSPFYVVMQLSLMQNEHPHLMTLSDSTSCVMRARRVSFRTMICPPHKCSTKWHHPDKHTHTTHTHTERAAFF